MRKNKIRTFYEIIESVKKSVFKNNKAKGFSLIELITALTITLVVLGVAVAVFSNALSIRAREGSKTDALNSAQAAINIMSREITNSGYGLIDAEGKKNNGIVTADSNNKRLHIRANITNNDLTTDDAGEDITFYYDADSQSVVRYDANSRLTSGIINRISNVEFVYYDYLGSTISENTVPTVDTGRVNITLTVSLPNVQGQPVNQEVKFSSDVTLRNSKYMLGQY